MSSIQRLGPYLKYQCNDSKWNHLCERALRYAIISLPFTINRMGLKGLEKRVFNIMKGKLSELVFEQFAADASLPVDFATCQTPFYNVDRKDFLFKGFEWDIKNNFLTAQRLDIAVEELNRLPALIPNNFEKDQWSKKSKIFFSEARGSKQLFSFMIGKLEDGPMVTEWAAFKLNKAQTEWLDQLNKRYHGRPQSEPPFKEAWFWDRWEQISLPWEQVFRTHFNSPIYITGYSDETNWEHFKEMAPRAFSDGMIRTRIINMCYPVQRLIPFSTLMEP